MGSMRNVLLNYNTPALPSTFLMSLTAGSGILHSGTVSVLGISEVKNSRLRI